MARKSFLELVLLRSLFCSSGSRSPKLMSSSVNFLSNSARSSSSAVLCFFGGEDGAPASCFSSACFLCQALKASSSCCESSVFTIAGAGSTGSAVVACGASCRGGSALGGSCVSGFSSFAMAASAIALISGKNLGFGEKLKHQGPRP